MTIKQQIHNWLYGENNRQENRRWHYVSLTRDDWTYLSTAGLMNPDPRRVWGIDISHWDKNVNLSETKARGGAFVFIKGLDGTVRTPYFRDNRGRAILAGLLHAPYLWLYPDNKVPCKAQATEATKLLKEFPADMPAMLDFEWTRYAGEYANPNYSDLDKWTTEYLSQGNRKPILYTAAGYISQFGPIPAVLKNKFSAICVANYGVINPTMPAGWGTGWDFWQFSSSGDAAIYAPNDANKLEVDLDYWRGSLSELYQFAGTTPGNGENPMPKYEAVALGDNTRLRGDHSTDYAYIGNYPRGTRFHGDNVWINPEDRFNPNDGSLVQSKGDIWLQVVDVNGTAKAGWVAITHRGFQICTITPDVEIPTEPVGLAPVPVVITLGDDVNWVKKVITTTVEPK